MILLSCDVIYTLCWNKLPFLGHFFPILQILLYIGLMCLTRPVGFYYTFVKQGLCYSVVSAVYGESNGPSALVGKLVRASFSGKEAEKSYAAMASSVNWDCACYTSTEIMMKGADTVSLAKILLRIFRNHLSLLKLHLIPSQHIGSQQLAVKGSRSSVYSVYLEGG